MSRKVDTEQINRQIDQSLGGSNIDYFYKWTWDNKMQLGNASEFFKTGF